MLSAGEPIVPVVGWCHGRAECIACGHVWIAVWPLGAAALECQECGSTDTDRTAEGVKET